MNLLAQKQIPACFYLVLILIKVLEFLTTNSANLSIGIIFMGSIMTVSFLEVEFGHVIIVFYLKHE